MAWKVHSENWKNLMIRKPASKAAFKVSRAHTHTDKQLLSCYNHRTICARAKKECTRSCFAETKFRRHFLKVQKKQDFAEKTQLKFFLQKIFMSEIPRKSQARVNLNFIFLHRHTICRCITDMGSPLCASLYVVPSSS